MCELIDTDFVYCQCFIVLKQSRPYCAFVPAVLKGKVISFTLCYRHAILICGSAVIAFINFVLQLHIYLRYIN